MEIRSLDQSERVLTGIVAPYDEISYRTPDPRGERICRGAFAKSIAQRETKIKLLRNHDQAHVLGLSRRWTEGAEGLMGEFSVRSGELGDSLLEDLAGGYMEHLSVGFEPLVITRGADGAGEVREGRLWEVSVVPFPAFEGAAVLAVRRARSAEDLDALLAPFRARPDVNLAPLPPILYRPH